MDEITEGAFPALDILYEDAHLVVVNKPAQMLVHRTEIANGDRVFAVQCVRDQTGRHVWPVHRLDRGTSGVLVFAFSADTARIMGGMMMAQDAVKKTLRGARSRVAHGTCSGRTSARAAR